MDERKAAILNAVIREHIETGVPVGSGVLVEKYDLGVSPATVRNVMAALEADGFITQPHTSAGRIPTERGYRRYLVTLAEKPLPLSERETIARILNERNETAYKNVARHLAERCGTAVFWAFHRRNLYYTGVTNLLKQPEFAHLEKVYDISTVIDRMDEIVDRIFESSNEGVQVLIGSENPFGHFCGSVIIRYRAGDHAGMVGLIGPMRMDYEGNLALVKELRNLLS